VSAHEIVAALPQSDDGVTNDQYEGPEQCARSRQPRVSNHPFPNVDVAALRTQAVLEGFIDFLRDAQSGKSLHAETLSRPAVEARAAGEQTGGRFSQLG
jgi:hypothetical protein